MMKRKVMALFTFLVVAISIVACGKTSIQEDLMTYLNEDLAKINHLQAEVGQIQQKFTDDVDNETVCNIMRDELIPVFDEIIEKVELIQPKTQDIKDINEIYASAVSTNRSAAILLVEAYEGEDDSKLSKSGEKTQIAQKKMADFTRELEELASEQDIEIRF